MPKRMPLRAIREEGRAVMPLSPACGFNRIWTGPCCCFPYTLHRVRRHGHGACVASGPVRVSIPEKAPRACPHRAAICSHSPISLLSGQCAPSPLRSRSTAPPCRFPHWARLLRYVECAQPISIRLGAASRVFLSVSVRTPSSSCALICCWSILFDSVKERAK
jgi:hypothetical protein